MIAVPASKAYELWADSYDGDLNPLLALEARGLNTVLDALSPRTVVDVGCGTGRSLHRFSAAGSQVFGVDASRRMLTCAVKNRALIGKVVQADAGQLPLRNGCADLALCCMTLSYCPEPAAVLAELSRVTNPFGYVIVTDLHPEASAAGWNRSFRAEGLTYRINHTPFSISSLQELAYRAGLQQHLCKALLFGQEEFPLFEAAGKGDAFPRVAATPAVLIAVWRKRC